MSSSKTHPVVFFTCHSSSNGSSTSVRPPALLGCHRHGVKVIISTLVCQFVYHRNSTHFLLLYLPLQLVWQRERYSMLLALPLHPYKRLWVVALSRRLLDLRPVITLWTSALSIDATLRVSTPEFSRHSDTDADAVQRQVPPATHH